jgi:hypothetical protein
LLRSRVSGSPRRHGKTSPASLVRKLQPDAPRSGHHGSLPSGATLSLPSGSAVPSRTAPNSFPWNLSVRSAASRVKPLAIFSAAFGGVFSRRNSRIFIRFARSRSLHFWQLYPRPSPARLFLCRCSGRSGRRVLGRLLNLLTVTRSDRLAVLELKASERIHLPPEAAGYWRRIRHHLERRDFARYRYFPGIELQAARPSSISLLRRFASIRPPTLFSVISRELESTRVGLAKSWRRGLRVVMRR